MRRTPHKERENVVKMLKDFREQRAKENQRLREERERCAKQRREELRILLGKEEDKEIKDKETEDEETEDKETEDKETEDEETEDEETEDEETEDEELESDTITTFQILEIIEKHPEGVKLTAIASKLDVHFLTLTGRIKRLLDEDIIEKDDLLYRIKKKKNPSLLASTEESPQEGDIDGSFESKRDHSRICNEDL